MISLLQPEELEIGNMEGHEWYCEMAGQELPMVWHLTWPRFCVGIKASGAEDNLPVEFREVFWENEIEVGEKSSWCQKALSYYATIQK